MSKGGTCGKDNDEVYLYKRIESEKGKYEGMRRGEIEKIERGKGARKREMEGG
jgi:hypothetical protein